MIAGIPQPYRPFGSGGSQQMAIRAERHRAEQISAGRQIRHVGLRCGVHHAVVCLSGRNEPPRREAEQPGQDWVRADQRLALGG